VAGAREGRTCQPIPLEASCHIADHVEVILAGFAEQSKTSVVHMCSLFHAFILCQLWTVYLENVRPATNSKASSNYFLYYHLYIPVLCYTIFFLHTLKIRAFKNYLQINF
jgi:hypothetical protein